MSKQYRTKRPLTVKWGPNATPISNYETAIPAGHPVDCGGRNGDGSLAFFASPRGLGFEPGSIEAHDATHYGIRLNPDDVEEVTEPEGLT